MPKPTTARRAHLRQPAKRPRPESRNGAGDVELQQPALVPMAQDEVLTAGRKLAAKVRDLEQLEEEHKAAREEQRAERTKLREEIGAIASTIRTQGR
jgi:hypothetical protein